METVGFRPNNWTPQMETIGFRPNNWTPQMETIAFRPNNWTPQMETTGFRPNNWTPQMKTVGFRLPSFSYLWVVFAECTQSPFCNTESPDCTMWQVQTLMVWTTQRGMCKHAWSRLHNVAGANLHSPLKAECHWPVVWPSGKALGWWAEGPRFDSASVLVPLQKLRFVDTVWWSVLHK